MKYFSQFLYPETDCVSKVAIGFWSQSYEYKSRILPLLDSFYELSLLAILCFLNPYTEFILAISCL